MYSFRPSLPVPVQGLLLTKTVHAGIPTAVAISCDSRQLNVLDLLHKKSTRHSLQLLHAHRAGFASSRPRVCFTRPIEQQQKRYTCRSMPADQPKAQMKISQPQPPHSGIAASKMFAESPTAPLFLSMPSMIPQPVHSLSGQHPAAVPYRPPPAGSECTARHCHG